MSYDQYNQVIRKNLAPCDPRVLDAFCQDVILRILPFVESVDKSSLWPRETERIDLLANMVRSQCFDWQTAGRLLDELTAISMEDDLHAMAMDGDLIQFLSALDCWREVVASGDQEAAAAVSEAIMNILDFFSMLCSSIKII